ncbi:hypothetical protein [Bacillus sp. SORGH_AS_0510]|uniref:hypothetical protein n=1 Tax=Bacillus sp. SORGH_AS_0510 TaxID=3041771 RepID=UPI0027D87BAD|nr:hypothetical protein [Bacillus sp. SORGH_AS_0510]
MKAKIFKILKELLKISGVYLLCSVTGGVLSSIFDEIHEIIMSISSLIFTSYFILKILPVFTWWNDKTEISRLKKELATREIKSLYMWSGSDGFEYSFFYEMLKDDAQHDAFTNLKLIKTKIKNKIGSNKSDYYLLKNYIEAKEKNSLLEKYYTIIFGLIVALLTTGLSKLMTSSEGITFISDILLNTKKHKPVENFQIVINIFNGFIFITSLLIFSISEFTREKRKLELFKGIIETIIFEKENS